MFLRIVASWKGMRWPWPSALSSPSASLLLASKLHHEHLLTLCAQLYRRRGMRILPPAQRSSTHPRSILTMYSLRSVSSWTMPEMSGTCLSSLMVSLQCPVQNSKTSTDTLTSSRSRKVHPHRLPRPTCRYYFGSQGWRGSIHRYSRR